MPIFKDISSMLEPFKDHAGTGALALLLQSGGVAVSSRDALQSILL